MDIKQAMKERHSVRSYQNRPLDRDTIAVLEDSIAACNKEGGLHIQLVKNEPKAFDSRMAHYGKFSGVTNYLALIGRKTADLEEKCGYYGEKLVLEAQILGLNTCWVAMTYKKIPEAFTIGSGEKLVIVIALGYGATQGMQSKSKSLADVSTVDGSMPQWFRDGVEAALLAPTAVNQQKFHFTLNGDKVTAKAGFGMSSKVDLGIVKYHFEVGSGKNKNIFA